MNRLGGLVAQLRGKTDVIMVLAPDFDDTTVDAARLIVENEGASPSDCLWLQGAQVKSEMPAAIVGIVVPAAMSSSEYSALLQRIDLP